jgi:hypothetical protein
MLFINYYNISLLTNSAFKTSTISAIQIQR